MRSSLGAFYGRLAARIGKAKAVTATARKIAVLKQLPLPFGDVVGVQLELLAQLSHRLVFAQCPCAARRGCR
jgi:hypothetical protein